MSKMFFFLNIFQQKYSWQKPFQAEALTAMEAWLIACIVFVFASLIEWVAENKGISCQSIPSQVHCNPDEDEAEEAAWLQEEEGRLLPHRHHLPRHLPHHIPALQHNLLVIAEIFFFWVIRRQNHETHQKKTPWEIFAKCLHPKYLQNVYSPNIYKMFTAQIFTKCLHPKYLQNVKVHNVEWESKGSRLQLVLANVLRLHPPTLIKCLSESVKVKVLKWKC